MLRFRFVLILILLLGLEAFGEVPSARVLQRYREMLEANPVEGTALDRLWKAHAEAGTTAALLKEYEGSTGFAGHMILGLLQRRAGNNDAAATAFERAALLDPDSPLPQLARGRLLMDTSLPRDAAEAFEQAAKLLAADEGPAVSPRLTETLLAVGAAWVAANEPEKAAEAWEKLAQAKPDDLALRGRLAEEYLKNHLPERAIGHLQYLGTHAPPAERPQALQQLATLYQGAGRADEAIQTLEQALALTGRGNWMRGELEGQLIRLYQRFGRTAELEARWKKYQTENPRDAGGWMQLAELYRRLGDPEQERAAVEGLVKLLPKSPEHRLRLAQLLTQADDLAGAAALYDELLKERPAQTELVFARAELEVRQDQALAARDRVAALLAQQRPSKQEQESLRTKALEFFREHRLWAEVESMLREEAASGSAEAVGALGQFLFSQHRDADAEKELRRGVHTKDAAGTQAGALLQVTMALKQQNLPRPALQAAREAIEQAAGDPARRREALLAAGELYLTLGDLESAKAMLEEGAALSKTPAETAEVDQRLFDILRQIAENERAKLQRAGPGAMSQEAELSAGHSYYEGQLRQMADTAQSVEAWLRLARWQGWGRNLPAMAESVERALTLDPNSVAVHEFAVKFGTPEASGMAPGPHLEKLIALDPANAPAYRRRLAQLEMQAGHVSDALDRLQVVAREHPGDVEVLADLALAQQAAERWSAALSTWRRVYELSPPARKRESLAPMLRIYEGTGQHKAAAELLLRETERRADLKEKRELFADLLNLCTQRELLPWLREKWEELRKRQPDDFFLETAYAELQKAFGDRAGAFETLSRALYTAPEPAAALPELVRQAEELRRFDAAIDFQTRLTRLGPQDRPEALRKLAELQERDFDVTAAQRTWEQTIRRFPRDQEMLRRAADFSRRQGQPERALALLLRVRGIEPASLHTGYDLAQLYLELGRAAEAEKTLEEILTPPPPPMEGENLIFPELKASDGARLQSDYLAAVKQRRGRASSETMQSLRNFWLENGRESRGDRQDRLGAVRDLARLVKGRGDAGMKPWVERWQKLAEERPNEALWAFYYVEATEPALDFVQRLMEAEPANDYLQQGFVWVALQLGGYERLGAWNQDRRRTTQQRDLFRVALGWHLRDHGTQVPKGLMAGVFPATARRFLWEGAELFAENGDMAEALELGQRALASADPLVADHRLQLAHWQLAFGQNARAQQSLAALALAPMESPRSPAFTALREAWLLMPDDARKPFGERVEHEVAKSTLPVHGILARLLLCGLRNDRPAARAAARELLAVRVTPPPPDTGLGDSTSSNTLTPGARAWGYLLSTGIYLQAFRLEWLASYLWEEALADRAMLRLEGDQAQEVAREVRTRLFALKLARADRGQFEGILQEYNRGPQPLEGPAALSEALENLGALPVAQQISLRLWEEEPCNPQLIRNVLNLCSAMEDWETTERVLNRCLDDRPLQQNDRLQQELVGQLVDRLEIRGAFVEAERVLDRALGVIPFDGRLLQRRAQLLEQAGRPTEAEAAWKRLLSTDPTNQVGRQNLAKLLEGRQKYAEAIAVLQKNPPPGSEPMLVNDYVGLGQVEEAAAMVERLSGPAYQNAVEVAATRMMAKDQAKAARNLLQTALVRTPDAVVAFRFQQLVVESLGKETPPPVVERELGKLRRLAQEDPARLGKYFQTVAKFATAPRTELEAAWGDGKGTLPAGVALLGWRLEHETEQAGPALTQILARADAGVDWLRQILTALLAAKRFDLAAPVQERLLVLQPAEESNLPKLVDYLDQAGQRAEAVAALEKWGAGAILADDTAAAIAPVWARLGQPERAETLYAQITGRPFARSGQPYLEHARLRLARGDVAGARPLLSEGLRYPSGKAAEALLEYAEASAAVDRPEEIAAQFALSPAQNRAYLGRLQSAHPDVWAEKARAVIRRGIEGLAPGGR